MLDTAPLKTFSPSIIDATSEVEYEAAKKLMIEYRETALAEDYAVGGSGLNEELKHFPGAYARPKGCILLAVENGIAYGCLALRPISETAGEVMRMYVQPQARGKGIAERLMQELIDKAKAMNYKELLLDSLRRFTAAHKLYEKIGFKYCEPYSPDTTEAMKANMVFMRLNLKRNV